MNWKGSFVGEKSNDDFENHENRFKKSLNVHSDDIVG